VIGELYSEIGDALWDDLGTQPKRESILCLLAHYQTENGSGAWCWNLTNLRHPKASTSDYCTIPYCSEVIGGHERYFARDTQAQVALAARKIVSTIQPDMCQFAAYRTLAEGVAAYLAFLKQPRYARSWSAMLAGEPNAYALALHDDRFYTADPGRYAKLLVDRYQHLDASLPTL
jgi:hypothetical protein